MAEGVERRQRADERGQMADCTVSRRFKPLVTEDHQAKLVGELNPKGILKYTNLLPSASCLLPSGAKRR